MFSLDTKAPQPVLPGPSTLPSLPATAGATASSGTVNTPDVAGQPSHDIHSTALQNMASGGPSGFQAAGKPYYDSDEWRRTAPALEAACGRQLLALDPTGVAGSDPYLDSPALDALAGHHFPVGTLNALLRYFWGDKTVRQDELVPATRVFIRRLEAEKTALGGVPADIARLNNAIRRDLVAALQQVVQGMTDPLATQRVDQAFMDDAARAMQTYFDTFLGLHAAMPRLLATLPLEVLIRLAMFNPSGSIAYPRMLHLAAVAPDFPVQPEFDVYVDPQGSLRPAHPVHALKCFIQNRQPGSMTTQF